MTIPLYDNVWEMCKFASVNQYTKTGAVSKVFKACMDYAINNEWGGKPVLISCRALKIAVNIYEKFGFKEFPLNKDFFVLKKLI